MFRLRQQKKVFSIEKSQDVSFNISNPAFDKDLVQREFSMPFNVPQGGNFNTIENKCFIHNNENNEENISLDLSGIPYRNGSIVQLSKSDGKSNFSFKSKQNEAISRLSDIKINKILEVIDTGAASFRGIRLRPQSNYQGVLSYSLKIRGVVFNHTEPFSPNMSTLAAQALFNQIEAQFPSISSLVGDEIRFENYQKNAVFEVDNSSVSNNITIASWETPAKHFEESYRSFANNAVDVNDNRVCFPVVHNPQFYEGKNRDYRGFVNDFYNSFGQNTTSTTQYEGGNTIIPFVKEKYIIDRIAVASGLDRIVVDLPDFEQFCIYNTQSNDAGTYDFHDSPFSGQTLGTKTYMHGYTGQIDCNKHVPDLNAKDYILGLCNDFGLVAVLENKILRLTSRNTFYKKKAIDLTKYADRSYNVSIVENKGYTINYAEENTGLQAVAIGAGTKVEKLHFSTLKMQKKFPFLYPTSNVPTITETGTSKLYGVTGEANKLIRLLYKGKSPINGTNGVPQYPFASNTNQNSFDQVDGQMSLLINGNNGLFFNILKDFLDLTSRGQLLKKRLTIPVGMFFNIVFQNQWNVRIYHPKGEVVGVIKEIKASFSNQRYGFIDVDIDVVF